jgi:hypothetical protein
VERPKGIDQSRPVTEAHQSAGFGVLAEGIDRRDAVAYRQQCHLKAASEKQWVGADQQRIRLLLHHCREGRIDVALGAGGEDLNLQADGQGRCGSVRDDQSGILIGGIDQERDARGARQQFAQEPEPLGRKLDAHGAETRDVAAGPVETGNKARLNRVGAGIEDDGNGRGCSLGGADGGGARGDDNDGHPAADQIGRQFRQSTGLVVCPTVFDRDIATLDVPRFAQPFTERRHGA